ncbi:MAG: hypothetical protein R6U96_17410 [Promethearchaeia archaeon]
MIFNTSINIVNLMWGIIFSAGASFLFALGIALQKKAVSNMEEIKLNKMNSIKEMFQNHLWVVGILLAFSGWLPYLIVTGLIGVALTQPLVLGLQLAFVVILGVKMLNEKLKPIEKIGFIIILVSPLFIALGNVSPPDVNIAQSDFQINFIIIMIIYFSLLSVLGVLGYKVKDHIVISGLSMALVSGILFGIGALLNQVGVVLLQNHFTLLVLGLVFFLIMFVCNVLATGVQQIAFQKSKVGVAFGLQATSNLLLAVIGGIIAFNQQVNFPPFFILGIIMIITGNSLLVQFQARIQEVDNISHLVEDSESSKETET